MNIQNMHSMICTTLHTHTLTYTHCVCVCVWIHYWMAKARRARNSEHTILSGTLQRLQRDRVVCLVLNDFSTWNMAQVWYRKWTYILIVFVCFHLFVLFLLLFPVLCNYLYPFSAVSVFFPLFSFGCLFVYVFVFGFMENLRLPFQKSSSNHSVTLMSSPIRHNTIRYDTIQFDLPSMHFVTYLCLYFPCIIFILSQTEYCW